MIFGSYLSPKNGIGVHSLLKSAIALSQAYLEYASTYHPCLFSAVAQSGTVNPLKIVLGLLWNEVSLTLSKRVSGWKY